MPSTLPISHIAFYTEQVQHRSIEWGTRGRLQHVSAILWMKGRYCLTVGNHFTRQSASGCVGKHVGQHTHDPSGQLASRSLHTAESFCRISDCLRESFTSRFWSSKDTTMYSIYTARGQKQSRVEEHDRDRPHLPRGAYLQNGT